MPIVAANQRFAYRAVFGVMLIALPSRNRIMVHLIYTENMRHMCVIRDGNGKKSHMRKAGWNKNRMWKSWKITSRR